MLPRFGSLQDSRYPQKLLRRLSFHLLIVLAAPGCAVTLGPVVENFLRHGNIRRLSFPCFQRRVLERAGIGETHFPRMGSHGVHGVEMLRGTFGALAAG